MIRKRMRFASDKHGQRIPLLDKDGHPILVQQGPYKGQPAFKTEPWLDQQGRPRWDAVVRLGHDPETGKPLIVQESFLTKRAAQDWMDTQKAQKKDGYQPTSTTLTFGAYLRDQWLPSYRTQVRSTYTIEKTIGKWILKRRPDTPFLGAIKLRELTVTSFDHLYVAMAKEGLQARGIEHLHGLLKRALKAAVRKGELARNPADFATLPKPHARAEIKCEADEEELGPVKFLTQEQATRFLAAAKQDRYSALWHVLLTGGLRPGEAFALQWRHVDLPQKLAKVRATLTRQGVDKKLQGWKLTPPKTDTSRRDVPLPEITMQELRRWKKQQAADRLLLGPEWQDHGFVFTTETGTPLGNNMERLWKRVCAKAGLGEWGEQPAKPKSGPTGQRPFTPTFRLYDLRHTSATLALLSGVDLLEVSRRLGHTDLAFTARTYGHVKAEHSTKSAAAFDQMFGT